MTDGRTCPVCGDSYWDIEITVEGRDFGPVPEGVEDFCLQIVVAPAPGAVIIWHDEEVTE